MRYLIFFALIFYLSSQHAKANQSDLCENGTIKCFQTEYKAYVKCVEKQRKKRETCNFTESVAPMVVQAIPVVQQQAPCTGQSCTYIDTCNGVNCQQPVINNCVNNCASACSGVTCQDRCQRSCSIQQISVAQPIVQQPIIQQIPQAVPSFHAASPNVTTIIKLTNIVNNTNIVNVTTSINNTNVNNLDLGSNATALGGQHQCCTVVQPKVCHKVNGTSNYKCIHRRHHTCGNQCGSHTLHAQVRQPCNGPVETCTPKVTYIPQPSPSCSYTPQWPYVSCGNTQTPDCAGCYDHYGYGYENYYKGNNPSCTGCYDDGYSPGSLYRQGPFYRQGYYHTPPCYLTGTCEGQQTASETAPETNPSYFENDLVDPSLGNPSYSPYSPYAQYGMAPYVPPQQMYYQPPPPPPPPPQMYNYPAYGYAPQYPYAYPYSYPPPYAYRPNYYPGYNQPEKVLLNDTTKISQDENAIIPDTFIDTYSPSFITSNPWLRPAAPSAKGKASEEKKKK